MLGKCTVDNSISKGINSLSFEPTIPSKFMVGTEQGGVIICRMQAKSGTNDWILGEFDGCHQGFYAIAIGA